MISISRRHDMSDGRHIAPVGTVWLSTCGKPALFHDGREIPVANRKSLALFAYLASTAHGSESRERLAGLLWSESSEQNARASLRQTVGDLKERLATCVPSPFSADRLNAGLDLSRVDTDIGRIRRALVNGEVDPLLMERKRAFESYLGGFDDLDPAFRTWLMVQRQCLHDEAVRGLEQMISSQTDLFALKRIGLALINLDPTHELGCRTAMEASVRLGDTAGALRLYKALWDVLNDEFDTEPSQKTQDLILDIKLGRIGPSPNIDIRETGLSDYAPQQSLSLLVGNFDSPGLTGDALSSIRIFRHELVAALVRFRDWAVIDLDGRGAPASNRPSFLIEATVFDDGRELRFVLTLKDVGTGRFVWSEQFSMELTGWYQTQQRIIRRIAVALDVSMSSERLMQVSGMPDLPLDQFDRWLKAQELIFRWRPQDDAGAEQLFRSIIAEAPRFAPAYAGIAGILNSRHLIFPGVFRSSEQHAEALRFAKTAVQIDPIDSRTQLHLGWSFAMNGMPEKAAVNFLLACELNANDPWALVSASLGLAYCADRENAERLSRMALDIGLGMSKLHWGYQAGIRFLAGDFRGCVEAAERAGDAAYYIGAWKAAASALDGDVDAAQTEAQRFVDLIRANWYGEEPPHEGTIARWLLHCFPIVDPVARANLRRGLELAGLRPTAGGGQLIAPRASSTAAADRVVGDA
jgi:DNA-binding transcriptional activator of the SARP family